MANMQNPVLKNVESGQIIELVKSPFSIGRGLTSDYVIENKIVSRVHCSLTKTDKGWTLTDSSTNGTLVNEGHYKGETSPILEHNDEISLGYQNYTYRFIIEAEKPPNCQVDKLRTQEFNGNTSVLNEVRSPGTPNSFDENGISDELLNNLADNMLSTVGEPTNIAEPQADDSLKNVEKPITSKSELTSHQSEQGASTSKGTIHPPTVTSTPAASDNMASNELNIKSNISEAVVTPHTINDVPEQLTSRIEELNNQNTDYNELTQSASNSSASTIIYTLPDEVIPEVPQTLIDNKAEASNNVNVIQNAGLTAAQASVGSTNAGGTVINPTISGTNTIAKSRDLLAESIEAVVQGYSINVTSSSTGTASPSTQGPSWGASTSNAASSTSALIVPTTVTMASPLNVNKKVKVMAVSSGVINQVRPVAGPAYTIGIGERAPVIRKLTQNEMQQILANQPGMPIVILDKFPPGSGPSIPATISTGTVSRNTMGAITTVTTSTHVTATATNSTNMPTRISILEGMRRSVHNTNLSVSTRNGIKRALRNYEQHNPGVLNTTTGGCTVRVSGNTLLQSAKNQHSTTGVSRICSMNTRQAANNQTPTMPTTRLSSGNTLLQSAENQHSTTGVSRIDSMNTRLQAANNQTPTMPTSSLFSANTMLEKAITAAIARGNTTAGSTTLVSGNTLLQTAEDQNATPGMSMIQTPNNQNTTALSTTTLVPQITTLQSTENHAVTTSNIISSTDVIDYMAVPAAVQEVVIEHTVKATGDDTNQGVPAIKCHDSQEPGTSKAPGKSEIDIEKQKNQNHYEEMENELMCTICANLFIKAVTLGCSHSFCQYCIGEWKKKKTDCPICRNKIASTTRTLVLDNIIEKMIETASEVDKEDRKSAIEERKKIEEAETAKKNQQNANKYNARGRRGRRVRGNARVNQGNNAGNQPDIVVTAPVITIPDSPSTTDGDDSSNNDSENSDYGYDYDDYYSDEWYNGRPGVYYGGYGSCYRCGERGHWANGCPNR